MATCQEVSNILIGEEPPIEIAVTDDYLGHPLLSFCGEAKRFFSRGVSDEVGLGEDQLEWSVWLDDAKHLLCIKDAAGVDVKVSQFPWREDVGKLQSADVRKVNSRDVP